MNIHEALTQIRRLVEDSRSRVAQSVNAALLHTYWEIGKIIIEVEQHGEAKAEYGKSVVRSLSKDLTHDLGKGFLGSNLFNMRNFYHTYQTFQTLSGKLSWSHYCELVAIMDGYHCTHNRYGR